MSEGFETGFPTGLWTVSDSPSSYTGNAVGSDRPLLIVTFHVP